MSDTVNTSFAADHAGGGHEPYDTNGLQSLAERPGVGAWCSR